VNELPPSSTVKLLVAVIAVGLLVGAALSIVVDRLITRQNSASDGSDRDWGGEEVEGPDWDSPDRQRGTAPEKKSVDAPTPAGSGVAKVGEVNGSSRSNVSDGARSRQPTR